MFTLKIKTDNAAFHENEDNGQDSVGIELARILHDIAEHFEHNPGLVGTCNINDINGNSVGSYTVKE